MLIPGLIGILWAARLLLAKEGDGGSSISDSESDLLKLLQNGDDAEGEEVPPEKYKDLGFEDGTFKGKKITKITKLKKEDSKDEPGSKEKVLGIENVAEMRKIKDIKKIKKMTKIDDDLADKMREEIKRGGSKYREENERYRQGDFGFEGNGEGELFDGGSPDTDENIKEELEKAERLKKLFNVTDLDDIVSAHPIKSMDKISSSMGDGSQFDGGSNGDSDNDDESASENRFRDRDGLSNLLLPAPKLNFKTDSFEKLIPADLSQLKKKNSDNLELENLAVHRAEGNIDRLSGDLYGNAKNLNQERNLIRVLEKMRVHTLEKLRMIEEVIKDHQEKGRGLIVEGEKIRRDLKGEQVEKLSHLKNIQKYTVKDIQEIADVTLDSKFPDLTSLSKYDTESSGEDHQYRRDSSGDSSGRYREESSGEYKYIDHSKYDKLPLKKIKSIKRIKSVLELTPEQAERLEEWQMERNRERNRRRKYQD